MGIFDFFKGGGSSASSAGGDKTIAKHVAKLTNLYMQHEDRMRAAESLAQINTDEALFNLLKRYDITLDKSYLDMDEKVYVKDLMVSRGKAAVEPIRRFLKVTENVNWPERILSYIMGEESEVIGVLLDVLDSVKDSGDMKGPQRARLLSLFTKYQDSRISKAVIPFLYDFDEGVRVAAAEVLDAQADISVREELFAAMTGPEEESTRVRRRILEIFVHHGWSVAEWLDTVSGWLPYGFAVEGDRIVEVS